MRKTIGVSADPEAIQRRVEVGFLVALLGREEAISELLVNVAKEVGVPDAVVQQRTDLTDLFEGEIRPRLGRAVEYRLFVELRASYDKILDSRLLEDRSSRPIADGVQHPLYGTGLIPTLKRVPDDSYGEFIAHVRDLIRGANYAIRRATHEGADQRYLKRSLRLLHEAADWLGLLRQDGQIGNIDIELLHRDFVDSRDRLVAFLEQRVGGTREATADDR